MSREPIRIRRIFQTSGMRPSLLWEISRRFHRLCPRYGKVAHALRTLSPVAVKSIATLTLPLDLHVLSLPLAFILSQDQTLLCIFYTSCSNPDAFHILLVHLFALFVALSCHNHQVAPSFAPQSLDLNKNLCVINSLKEINALDYLVLGTCLYFPSNIFKDLNPFV